jgi:hypothetical protein
MQPLHLYISANDHTEIGRLLKKHDLRITQVDCKVYTKIVGIGHQHGDTSVGSLWQMPCRRGTIRRTKKAIKKFLRQYDKSITIKTED